MVYNLKEKTLDLGNLKATNYKYNKEVYLPKAETPELETLHEYRRTEFKRIFNRAVAGSDVKSKCKVANDRGLSNSTKTKVVNPESNLSKSELKGLASLKKKVREGSLVVGKTDKSKRFAILSRQQYLDSGRQHTQKDIEIDPDKVKRLQNYVNDHVYWLKESTNIGLNWQHSDRMTKNLIDKGEQVCQMQLLLKDHKDWSEESGKAIPSRPVVSGNNGLNCHLSELVSLLIEPVAFEHDGSEVDSTDDMLAKINELNSRLSNPIKTSSELNDSEDLKDTDEIMSTGKSLSPQKICQSP